MSSIFRQSEEEKRREEAEERQRHNLNLNAASAQADKPMDRAYIDKMTDHQLSQGTIDILSNLLDQDYLLGNMTEAEVHEFRWLARVLRLKVEAMHPPQEGVIARATRGKDGWQQTMFNKTISASETRKVDDDDDGGFL